MEAFLETLRSADSESVASSSVGSSSSSDQSSSSSSSSSSQSRLRAVAQQAVRDANRSRTEKARQAAFRQRCFQAAQQKAGTTCLPQQLSFTEGMQSSCFAKVSDKVKHACPKRHWLQRGLLAYLKSYMAWLKKVLSEASPDSYIIAFNVMDDCSIRLANTRLNSSTVHTVCNNYQRILFHSGDGRLTTFRVHQPTMIIPSGAALDLHTSWSSWLMLSSHGIGSRLSNFGIVDADVVPNLRCQVLMSDGLKTNDAVFSLQVNETLRSVEHYLWL